jgi:NADPH:quinone reductase
VDRVAQGIYKTKPAAVFPFNEMRDAQRLMESNKANGKIVITV